MIKKIFSVLSIVSIVILIIYRLGISKLTIFEYVLLFLIALQVFISLTDK